MTHNSLLAFLILLCVEASGQVSISSSVTDGKQELPSVTVLLLMVDSTLVKGAITDKTGQFVIENVLPGNYLLSVSMTGYDRSVSSPLPVERQDITLPSIQLNESVTALQEVVVTAEKQLFDQQIDRLVINVGSSVTSFGNTILEVIQKSPGVVVNRQTNTISMNGKSGVRVMMNDKMVQLPLDVVVQMLDGMSASNVEKIELITAPPAKYDAEGNAGIIHIVTRGQEDMGTNGSFGLTAGARWAEHLAGNFNLNHRKRRIACFLDYSILRNHNLHIMKMERQTLSNEFEQTAHDYSRRENITIQQNLSAGFEWKPSRNTVLTFLITGYRRNWDLHAYATDIYRVKADSTMSTGMTINESNIWQSATGSIGIQTQLGAKGEISVNLDYLYYNNSNPSQYDLNVVYEQQHTDENFKIDLTKTTPIRFLIAKADYQYHISPSLSLETGFKAVASALDNNVLVRRGTDYPLSTDPALTSYSTLGEQVAALYVSTKWQGGNQWQINTGIRYEYTHTAISTPDQKNLINRKYGYIFPNVSVKKTLDTERDMQFSYSRRITRPTYNDIAPFVFFWSPNTFSAGNTSLYPAITDAISAGYHVKQWILSVQLSHARNEITFLQPENDNANNLIYRSQNLKYLNAVGVTNSYSITPASWWDVLCNLTAQYHVARAEHLSSAVTQRLYGVNINMVNQFKLGNGFTAELSGMYQSKLIAGISQYLPFGSLNAGIQKKLGKAIIRLAVDDMLNTNNWRIKTNSVENNLNSYFNYQWHNRFIRISYTYNFGNNKLHAVKPKSGSEEERGRVN